MRLSVGERGGLAVLARQQDKKDGERQSAPPVADTGLWAAVVPVALNSVIGAFLLFGLVPDVVALYEQGYGRFSVLGLFVLLPLGLLVISTGVPIWLCWRGYRGFSAVVACFLLFFGWGLYFLFLMEAFAI